MMTYDEIRTHRLKLWWDCLIEKMGRFQDPHCRWTTPPSWVQVPRETAIARVRELIEYEIIPDISENEFYRGCFDIRITNREMRRFLQRLGGGH